MKIELKKISYSERLSEETAAFSADLYVNGVKRGFVSNHGTGGPDEFSDRKAEDELNAYGATLPLHVSEYDDPKDPTGKMTFKQTAESLVGDILDKHLKERDAKRIEKKLQRDLQKRVVFTVKGKKGIYHTRQLEPARLKEVVENNLVKDADIVLNRLPFESALQIFREQVTVA